MRIGSRVQGHPCRAAARSLRDRSLALAAAALVAAACSGDPSPASPDAGAETPTILATTSIWGDVVANVACDGLAEVGTIIPVGSDPHGYEPSLQDTERMTNASLVVANGLTLEGRLADTLGAGGGVRALRYLSSPQSWTRSHSKTPTTTTKKKATTTTKKKATTTTDTKEDDPRTRRGRPRRPRRHGPRRPRRRRPRRPTKKTPTTTTTTWATTTTKKKATDTKKKATDTKKKATDTKKKAKTTTDTKEGDHGHEEEGHDMGHDDHGHAHGAEDPHVWFDPHRVAEALPVLAQALTTHAGLDPAAVEACLASYRAELEAVDAEIAAKVSQLPAGSRKLVTNHEALGYYADRYGFEVIGTVIPSPSSMAEPNPAGLERLAEIIEHEGIKAIFAETQHSGDDIEVLAAEVGDVEVVTLYTGSLGPPGSGAETYLGYLRTNTDLIVDSLN